jgi:glutamate-1-semialdehyde 2,1-aminomutase
LFRRRKIGWLAFGRFSAFHILPRTDIHQPNPKTLTLDDYLHRPNAQLQKLKMALNLEGIDMGARGTGFLSGIHTQSDVDTLVLGFDRALNLLELEE